MPVRNHFCSACGDLYAVEPCDHSNTAPVAGDFGRKFGALEVCQDCGYTYQVGDDGLRTPLGVADPETGIYPGPEREIADLIGLVQMQYQDHRCRRD